MNPWSEGALADGGSFQDTNGFHHIYSLSSMNICTDDVVITGVRVVEETTEDSEEDEVIYQSGEDGYVLTIDKNKLIQNGRGADAAAYLGNKLIGLQFRPLNASCLSDPSIEAGDIAFITDRKGRSYATLITNTVFSAGNYQQVSCGAETPARNSSGRASEATRVYQELRKKLKKDKTEWVKAIEALGKRLETSSGLYSTIEILEDGSKIYYMHNKPALAESLIVWKMTAEAWGVSTDGGKTWNGGMTVDGEMITRILNTIGLNADWINTGALVVKDSEGNILFNADIDTGRVDIVADSFTLRGKTVEDIAKEGVKDYVDTVVTDAVKEVSTQHFHDYDPGMNNEPALSWTTDEMKTAHLDDLFYNTATKKTFRFVKDDTGFHWEGFVDPDIQKALDDAADARDTADGKRRVFVTTPAPPYDVGDIWAQGSNGDIMCCQTARASGVFVSSDWVKASKYTDDSALNTFINGDFKNQMDALEKQNDKNAETWYQSADPSSAWNTDVLKSEHTGDIWYNTSNQRYYLWNGTAWMEMKVAPPDDIFDKIDGKSKIFVARPIPPYDPGDLWITSTTNGQAEIRICVTARTEGSYTASDWIETKYAGSDDINQAITDYDTSLGQSEIFNKLTNGGQNKGIYIQNGELYINASYILAGVLAGNFINAKGIKVQDNSGNTTFYIDDNGNVTLRCTTFSLSGNTIQNIANSAAGSALSEANSYTDTAKQSAINTAASDASAKANSALNSAKSYTDTQIAQIDTSKMTQQEVFNILTNNGQTQGIYLYGGKIYINASYIDTGYLAGWLVGDTSLSCTVNGCKVTLDAATGTIYVENNTGVYDELTGLNRYGTTLNGYQITGCNADLFYLIVSSLSVRGDGTFGGDGSFDGTGSFGGKLTVRSGGASITGIVTISSTLTVNGLIYANSGLYTKGGVYLRDSGGTTRWSFEPGTDSGTIYDKTILRRSRDTYLESAYTQTTSGGSNLRILSGGILYRYSSSSKRYKEHVKELKLSDISKLYELPVVWFKYKDGILIDSDYRKGRAIPGFYAEDIEKLFQIAADYEMDENGDLQLESWNERILIPPMLKLIQEQKLQLDALGEKAQESEKKVNTLTEELKQQKTRADAIEAKIARLEQKIGGA